MGNGQLRWVQFDERAWWGSALLAQRTGEGDAQEIALAFEEQVKRFDELRTVLRGQAGAAAVWAVVGQGAELFIDAPVGPSGQR